MWSRIFPYSHSILQVQIIQFSITDGAFTRLNQVPQSFKSTPSRSLLHDDIDKSLSSWGGDHVKFSENLVWLVKWLVSQRMSTTERLNTLISLRGRFKFCSSIKLIDQEGASLNLSRRSFVKLTKFQVKLKEEECPFKGEFSQRRFKSRYNSRLTFSFS